MISENLHIRFKEFREHLGVTQSSLGKALGVTGAAISDIERAKTLPTTKQLAILIRNNNLNIYWLLFDVGQKITDIQEIIEEMRRSKISETELEIQRLKEKLETLKND